MPNNLPCCFFLALSHIAGLRWTVPPVGSIHLLEHTRTPRHDFFNMCTLWLLVFLIAHPEACLFASSLLGEYTNRQWPSAHSSHESRLLTC